MTTIDVHSHVLPQIYLDALKTAHIDDVDGFPTPEWTMEAHLAMMGRQKIQACVLSLSSPGLAFADPQTAANLARAINVHFADIIREYPARFGAFGLLPMPDVEASLKEIEYALDVLKLDGIGLFTNYEGKYLGSPDFAPIFDELHRRKAVVFVHPTTPPHSEELTLGYPAPMLEYPFDSTRMVASLLDTDTLERCDHIRLIVSHGGGTLPLLMPRIAALMQVKKGGNKLSALFGMKRAEKQIGRLFFDLTAATHPAFLAALKASHDTSQLLAGYDFPFMPEISINRGNDEVRAFDGFSDKDRAAMDAENAKKLFPRLEDAIRHAP